MAAMVVHSATRGQPQGRRGGLMSTEILAYPLASHAAHALLTAPRAVLAAVGHSLPPEDSTQQPQNDAGPVYARCRGQAPGERPPTGLRGTWPGLGITRTPKCSLQGEPGARQPRTRPPRAAALHQP